MKLGKDIEEIFSISLLDLFFFEGLKLLLQVLGLKIEGSTYRSSFLALSIPETDFILYTPTKTMIMKKLKQEDVLSITVQCTLNWYIDLRRAIIKTYLKDSLYS